MTNVEDRPPPAVGAYWIKEEDYPALLKIFDDENKLPRSWKEWLKMAEEMERGLKAYGHVVMRVAIDPNGRISTPSVISAGYRSPKIASTISGASSVSRRTQLLLT